MVCKHPFGPNLIWPRDGHLHVAKRERIWLLCVELTRVPFSSRGLSHADTSDTGNPRNAKVDELKPITEIGAKKVKNLLCLARPPNVSIAIVLMNAVICGLKVAYSVIRYRIWLAALHYWPWVSLKVCIFRSSLTNTCI